jgi:hypothetical protein
MGQACRRYCRVVAMVFLLVTVYTVVTKLAEDRLSGDWLHSVLHVASAAAGAYAGWGARTDVLAVAYTGVIGVWYLLLGLYGWFTDGLLLDTPLAIPLTAADNVFHLSLGVAAVLTLALSWARGDRTRPFPR